MKDQNFVLNTDVSDEPIVVDLSNIPEYDKEEYDLTDPKMFKKYIIDIKYRVRGSYEYQSLIQFLRYNIDMDKCAVFENLNNSEMDVRIEIHHHPFTLEDIVLIVYNKRLNNKEPIDVESVCLEVMSLHYNMLVGLIPLSQSVHEAYHNSVYTLPMNKVFGHVNEFYEMYKDYMSPDMIELYNHNMASLDGYSLEENNKIFREKHIQFIKESNNINTEEVTSKLRDLRSEYYDRLER